MIHVFDSSAMVAFLRKEVGWEEVAHLTALPGHQVYAHGVNLCEVYYDAFREWGEEVALTLLNDLYVLGIASRTDMDDEFFQDAGRIKAVHRRVSLADCFCIALARRIGGEVVTTDHHEFDPLVPHGLCPIRFIR